MMPMGGVELEDVGLTYRPRRLSTGMVVVPVHYGDDPAKDADWVAAQSARYGGQQSHWWRQNMELELIRGGSPVWPMLRSDVHVRTIPPSDYLSASWSVYRALDHGVRHPTCCAWGAVHKNGDVYFFRQYYQTDAPIELNTKRIVEMSPEWVEATVADPAIWTRSPVDLEEYATHYMRAGLEGMTRADNARVGYDTLTTMFLSSLARWCIGRRDLDTLRDVLHAPDLKEGDAHRMAGQPAIWFSPECAAGEMSLYQQCANLRYRPDVGDPQVNAPSQKYVDVDDEGPDVVRYMCQSPQVRWCPGVNRKRERHEVTVADIIDEHIAEYAGGRL